MEKPIVIFFFSVPLVSAVFAALSSVLTAPASPSEAGFEQPAENASENRAMKKVERRIKVTSESDE
ncbi:hypothetical protein WME81_36825 [Sorangium sp. So ce1078]